MAARKNPKHLQQTRDKIQAACLINRLQKFIMGTKVNAGAGGMQVIDLSPAQVTAALGLLKKTLPDLQSVEVDANINETRRVVSAEAMKIDEWENTYGGVATTARASESTH